MATVTIYFYKNFHKRTNSTNIPGESDAKDIFNCFIKDNCVITEPVIEVVFTGSTPTNPMNPAKLGYNYAFIEDYNRYYFINEWTYYKGVWSASLRVDVLGSYKTEIGNLNKYVLRSASRYNPNIIDNYMTILPPVKKIVPAMQNNALWSPFSSSGSNGGGTSGLYIVGIQVPQPSADVPSKGGVCYYPFSYEQMTERLVYLTSSSFANLQKDDAAGLTAEVVKMLQDPSQYIVSCMWFPWTISTSGTVQPQIGFWNTSPLVHPTIGLGSQGFTSLNILRSLGAGINIPDHPQEQGGEYGPYLRCAPYSFYKFHLEPWGDIDIDGSSIIDCERISGSINIDYITGAASLNLFANKDSLPSKTVPLGRYTAQVGVNVGISQLMYEMQSIGSSTTSMAAGAAHSLSSIWESSKVSGGSWLDNAVDTFNNLVGNLFRKNEDGQRGISTVIQDAISSGLAYMATPSRSGVNGSYISYYGTVGNDSFGTQYFTQGPYLEVLQFTAVENNNIEQGRPLMKTVTLNTLSGFIKCADGDCNIPSLETEKMAISSYLTGGFFYE